jgi:hypothetical protein
MTETSWTSIVEREHRERRRAYAMALVLLAGVFVTLVAVISQV